MNAYSNGVVTSADGTSIGYRRIGQGPGIVLVQGAMGAAYHYDQLARALAGAFTAYLPDRRERGMSLLAYTPVHTIQRDIDDVGSVLAQTGARYVFGLSSGAIIALAATEALSSIDKAAIYEPPFYPEGISQGLIRRFNEEVGQGRLAAALVTASRIVKLGPKLLKFVPQSVLQIVTKRTLDREARVGSGDYVPLRELVPSMRYDFNVVLGMDGNAASFAGLRKEVLLLGGDRSPEYLQAALTRLEGVLPNARRIEFKGLDHSGPWNADQGGHPEPVADALRAFFAS
jgi:pimeloyl-ACP methyl ester carboxylesterase